jgi:hypothetical protein
VGRRAYLDRIAWTEHEFQPVYLAGVQWVVVHDLDVHDPFFQVVGFDERYAGRELVVELYWMLDCAGGWSACFPVQHTFCNSYACVLASVYA